jgi:mannose-1-phosphate guanylyltransferase
MKIDYVLILGAGLGTRMGPVGKDLPKLLWPVFEKSLLELQVEFAKNFNPKEIFVNTHYEYEKIHNHINDKKLSVTPVHENDLLDIGGGIHNLSTRLNYEGRLLILNGDQFLFFDEVALDELFEKSLNNVVTLMGIEVDKESNYNELILKDSKLTSIEKPSDNTPSKYQTYSGVSIVNMNLLDRFEGPSKFFETVASFKSKKVEVVSPHEVEYTDFGTAKRYLDSMRDILLGEKLEMRHFLLSNLSLIKKKIRDNNCYNCNGLPFSINLTDEEILGNGSIIIESGKEGYPEDSIVYRELVSRSN